MTVRKSSVAGSFYPESPDEIIKMFEEALQEEKKNIKTELKNKNIVGGVSPHAGYMYCVREAVHLFEILREKGEKYDTVVIVNPNHTGYGEAVSVDSNESWETPFGGIEVDTELGAELSFPKEPMAQRFEHSGEVMLPYLYYFLKSSFKILPICMMRQDLQTAVKIAEKVKDASEKLERKILLLISSDFTHFQTPEKGAKLDSYAIESLLKMDSSEFQDRVLEKDISICGMGPIMVLLEYSKMTLKNPKLEILKRGHSGEVYPSDEVVDYVSIVVYEEETDPAD
ncbi:AmmeMemoRadiSam system protein B [uncultured Ilyobacter sp.]|uniref:AmmeMemoRadiSam system protein B n=1 Tax=uncultured Ilyobacter sp. TaxID=544433 RepID=UPI0029C75DE1|nr:AmmeMemoRadiSam system protein B [uncultured Ilyobacter sp.]